MRYIVIIPAIQFKRFAGKPFELNGLLRGLRVVSGGISSPAYSMNSFLCERYRYVLPFVNLSRKINHIESLSTNLGNISY
jgi:hypothetical protein